MTILREFDEKHPKQVSAYAGEAPTIAFAGFRKSSFE
jgi:hypothetical protein